MAYGDNRTSVATDTFDSEISASWENGGGDWGTFDWVTGGHVQISTSGATGAIRRNSEAFADDQYSKVTVNAQTTGGSWIGAAVRMQAGTDESAYVGYADGDNTLFAIYEVSSAFGFTSLADTSGTGDIPLSAGETLTLEAEGTTLRFGSDADGADGQEVSTTDATLASGDPGASIYTTDVVSTRITAWEGGDIGAAGATDYEGTGDLDAQNSTVSGAGLHGRVSTGALSAQAATISGAGVVGRTGAGALSAQATSISGAAIIGRAATGDLEAQSTSIAGAGVVGRTATGDLEAQDAAIDGSGTTQTATFNATGDLQAQSAQIAGSAVLNRVGSGVLESQNAIIVGAGTAQISVIAPPVSRPTGGGGGLGWFKTKKGKRYFSQFFDDIVDEMKREMEMEAVRAEMESKFASKGRMAKADLDAAKDFVAEVRRKRKLRRAASIMLLDSH